MVIKTTGMTDSASRALTLIAPLSCRKPSAAAGRTVRHSVRNARLTYADAALYLGHLPKASSGKSSNRRQRPVGIAIPCHPGHVVLGSAVEPHVLSLF